MKNKLTPANYLWLILGGIFFIFPLLAAVEFSLRKAGNKGYDFSNYSWFLQEDGFITNLRVSIELAVLTAILVLILMVPTVVYTHLGGKKYRQIGRAHV